MAKKFYLHSAIPYVNAAPHIGHAQEFVYSDVIRRYQKLIGKNVAYLCGADENALKIVQAAEKAGKDPQSFCDINQELFRNLAGRLNVQFDFWQRGTDKKHHFLASQKLWELCAKNGDIYKKSYEGLYCVGCEAFYTEDELVNGECSEHPGKKLEKVSESNYFFKLSKYQKHLIDLISSDELKIYPEFRKNEVLQFLKKPLLDISVSRSNERAKNWGVPVPGDNTQRMYVWFDALNIYRSGVAEAAWPADLHVIGKGIIRFHAVYWPAFLLSADLPLPKGIFAHGYLTVNGQKMSKTVGNIIDPLEVVKKYGTDALRYYLLREIPSADDGDFSYRRLDEIYNADLANELGNLVSRLTNLGEKDALKIDGPGVYAVREIEKQFDNFHFNLILENIWSQIKSLNKKIDDFAPWKKNKEERKEFLTGCFKSLKSIAFQLQPFLPETAGKIIDATSGEIKKIAPLFPRLK